VPMARQVRELDFMVAGSGVSDRALIEAVDAEFGIDAAASAARWSGFLRGFIDLVFEHRGRYYLLDWKSNHLGDSATHYAASPLAAAMDNSSAGGGSSGDGSSHFDRSDTRQASAKRGGTSGEVQSGGRASVVAKVGKVAAGTVANLAQGTWDVAKAKAGEMGDAAMDRIGETTGGKIAAAIKARGDQKPVFGSDSLAKADDQSVDAESEVAAFRDRAARSS